MSDKGFGKFEWEPLEARYWKPQPSRKSSFADTLMQAYGRACAVEPANDLFVLAAARKHHIGWMDVTEEQRKEAKDDLLGFSGELKSIARDLLDKGQTVTGRFRTDPQPYYLKPYIPSDWTHIRIERPETDE